MQAVVAKKKRHSRVEIATKLAQANELATRGKLQSDIARTLRVSVMTFLSEAAFAWRVRSRATCRLSTIFTPFDRELSFMISPVLSPPSCNRQNGTAFCALWRLRSGPQSQPIDPEMFGTKAPRIGASL